ncbi:MAG: hypothetical protein LUG85_03190 [Clostridiales bacterium]|nr:hypothetical protein [Clostridiales bacterium]
MKKVICILILLIILVCGCSCGSETGGSVNFGDYEISSEYYETTTQSYDSSLVLDIDTSWQTSYALSYTFYDSDKGYSEIVEGRCENYYQSMDMETGIITFLSQEDGYIMEYVLEEASKTGTAAIITDSDMESLYSGFALMSACDPYLPVYTNVTKVGDDFVANRSATRYKQVQTEDGVETKIAYIWIDDRYSFASKCELYDGQTQELLLRWELTEFTLNVTEDSVRVNLDEYTLTTE